MPTEHTISTQHDTPLFDPEDHRKLAAEQMGVDPSAIHCTMTGPDGFEVLAEAVYSETAFSQDGTVLKGAELISPRRVRYDRFTTWALKPVAPVIEAAPPPEPEPEIVPWPTIQLTRGSKWHGPVTIEGVTAEHTFISDGTRMVLLDSPDGKAVLGALKREHEAHQAATGG